MPSDDPMQVSCVEKEEIRFKYGSPWNSTDHGYSGRVSCSRSNVLSAVGQVLVKGHT